MQPTTMTDINEMEEKAPNATFVVDTDPDSAAETTTAPQEQLKNLDSEIPKQPTGNQ